MTIYIETILGEIYETAGSSKDNYDVFFNIVFVDFPIDQKVYAGSSDHFIHIEGTTIYFMSGGTPFVDKKNVRSWWEE